MTPRPPEPALRFFHLDLTACGHGPDPGRPAARVNIGGRPYEIPARCGAGRDIAYWTCTVKAGIPGGGYIGGPAMAVLA